MTYRDVFCQILAEVSGKSKTEIIKLVNNLVNNFEKTHKFNSKFGDKLSDKEAKEMLESLRKEKIGIREWLKQGFLEHINQN